MQTQITDDYLNTKPGKEADAILRSCVHCGLCNATCPTYQLLGNELDGPRGRIYLIKQILEGQAATYRTQNHLDRCLSCLSCETTCPSGVQYGRLVDIGREIVDSTVKRSLLIRIQRYVLRKVLPYPQRFAPLLHIGQWLKPILPTILKQKIPSIAQPTQRKQKNLEYLAKPRKMLALQGCVQSVATPKTHQAAANILQKLGIELVTVNKAGCCGAISQHLSAQQEALHFIRANIDAWWPLIEQGVEAIVMSASGCGAMVKQYHYLLKHDAQYADKAARVSELAKDISEILIAENIMVERMQPTINHIAFQSPCTLQHSQQLEGVVESLLTRCGFKLCHVTDAHLCCGSAGTYSILQADLSQQLLNNKLNALQKQAPELIVTANVGCQLHLQSQAAIPVKHWIELLDDML